MYPRQAFALAVALGALFATARADAWQGAHEMASAVEIHVDPDGVASVEQKISVSVARGPLRSIEIVSLEAGQAVIDPTVAVTAEDGRTLSARVVPPDAKHDRTHLQIVVDDPRSFARGMFVFRVRYRIDWVASGALTRDGALWRLTWSSPVAADGLDLVTTTLDLPAAPEPPRPILPDTGAVDDSVVSSLKRDASRDILCLVRPHLGRGESVTWTVRLDPRALPAIVDPRLRPPFRSKSSAMAEPDRVRGVSLTLALGAVALGFALLVWHKGRVFATACAKQGLRVSVIPGVPEAARALLAGAALAVGIGLQVTDRFARPTAGALLVALATVAATLRSPAGEPRARRAGRWLALRPEDAFADAAHDERDHWLDVGTRSGRLAAMGAVVLAGVGAVIARTFAARGPWLVALDAVALVPIWATGRSACLPPEGGGRAAPWLARAFDRLRAIESLRVIPWARIVSATASGVLACDELRLLVLPHSGVPGVVGIEIGLAWSGASVGWAASPEVLVRVIEGSEAAARIARFAPSSRASQGRRPDERVMRLVPRAPTCASVVALVEGLVRAVTVPSFRETPRARVQPSQDPAIAALLLHRAEAG